MLRSHSAGSELGRGHVAWAPAARRIAVTAEPAPAQTPHSSQSPHAKGEALRILATDITVLESKLAVIEERLAAERAARQQIEAALSVERRARRSSQEELASEASRRSELEVSVADALDEIALLRSRAAEDARAREEQSSQIALLESSIARERSEWASREAELTEDIETIEAARAEDLLGYAVEAAVAAKELGVTSALAMRLLLDAWRRAACCERRLRLAIPRWRNARFHRALLHALTAWHTHCARRTQHEQLLASTATWSALHQLARSLTEWRRGWEHAAQRASLTEQGRATRTQSALQRCLEAWRATLHNHAARAHQLTHSLVWSEARSQQACWRTWLLHATEARAALQSKQLQLSEAWAVWLSAWVLGLGGKWSRSREIHKRARERHQLSSKRALSTLLRTPRARAVETGGGKSPLAPIKTRMTPVATPQQRAATRQLPTKA